MSRDPFLDVSFSNNIWKLLEFDRVKVTQISEKFNIPYILAVLLNNRGVLVNSIDDFINPKLKNLMPNPFILSDTDKAVDRIIKAINNQEYICIYGDYDVDGATSSALLYKFLVMIGYNPDKIKIHIPDRITDGYGLNCNFIEKLYKELKYSLIITVDCGITAIDEVDYANSHNFDVIVIDHHQPGKELPNAEAVVNPKKLNESVDLSYMAAVGVCFFVLFALHTKLKYTGYYHSNLIDDPDLLSLLDLVALGTVCDVVPVIGINRAFINTGIQVLSNRTNIGIKLLCEVAEVGKKLIPYHLGFVLGPRINAGGRIGDSSIGVKLLCSKDSISARSYAEQLNSFNLKRREMENIYLNEALGKLNIDDCKNNNLVFVSGVNWHSGVIGIIAGKLKEKYNLPTFVSSIDEVKQIAKGSARSVENINIGYIVAKAKEKGLIINGGGHDMAAGFTYSADKEKEFINFLIDEIKSELKGNQITHTINIDSIIDVSAVNLDFAYSIDKLSPYGPNNPEPCFLIKSVRLIKIDIIKSSHLLCIFVNTNNYSVRTISFKSVDTNMGQILLKNIGKSFDIIGKIRINSYKDSDSVSFLLEDAKFSC